MIETISGQSTDHRPYSTTPYVHESCPKDTIIRGHIKRRISDNIDQVYRLMMIGSKLQTISLFSGCGGLDFGAEQAGAEVILATDIDKDSVATLHKYSKGKEIIEGDIADI